MPSEHRKKKMREYQQRYVEKNRELIAERNRRYREANREKVREANRRYRENHPEADRQSKLNHYLANKAYYDAQSRAYWQEHAEEKREHTRKRRRCIAQATPSWANRQRMREIYAEAKRVGLSVDHIIPLQHPLVCGLHCEQNLQIISLEENLKKWLRYSHTDSLGVESQSLNLT